MKTRLPKLMVLGFATLLLVSCGNKTKETGLILTDGDLTTTEREEITTVDDLTGFDTVPVETFENQQTGPVAGSVQDFIVNTGDHIFFGSDQHDLSIEGRNTLERQASWLRQYSNIRITIEGHADERGTREYNLALGERRAQSVRNYLTALGVDGSRINTISYGKERPVAIGSSASAWSQNRRAVTVIE